MEQDKQASFWRLFWIFFRIGCFSFGGGYAMMPFIEREIVVRNKWMNQEDVVDVFAVAQSLPGAIAVNSVGIVGYKVYGIKGALAGILGVVLPAFFVISIIAAFFMQFKDIPAVQSAFSGVRAAVVALIVYAVLDMARATIPDWFTAIIAIASVVAIYAFDVSPILLIVASIIIGLILYRFFPKQIKEGGKKKHD